ncbi:MAG: class I SAM-dependent methyltransferase [Candidatus Nitrosopumilus sp. bin_68KS]
MSKSEDKITKKVKEMYLKYPYPSPSREISQTNELLNLLKIFEIENKKKIENMKILDAGSGSGHRIINVAKYFKKCEFIGADISNYSLEIANELRERNKIENIHFVQKNILTNISKLGKFDLILCMGVLHHLSNPKKGLQILSKMINSNGIIFLYVYGKLGGHKRMLNKELISSLLGEQKTDYELGIKLVRGIGFNKFDYGWNLKCGNIEEENSLIVDSLMHINEELYDSSDIDNLFKKSGLYGYAVYGISVGKKGLLLDIATETTQKLLIPQTNIAKKLNSKLALEKYESKNVKEKYRILELLYEPNGYTIVGFTKKGYEKITNDRIKRNFIKIS